MEDVLDEIVSSEDLKVFYNIKYNILLYINRC